MSDNHHPVDSFESISTWKQPAPPQASHQRQAVIDRLAGRIVELSPKRLRIAVDGYTASGKTTFANELAAAVRDLGRSTLRASFDDFKKPWRDAVDKGYDRVSGEGYYRNAPDFESARELLMRPAGPAGSGLVVLCAHDPLTGEDHRAVVIEAPTDAVLIVDSVFALRPEYVEYWDLTIWLDIPQELALERGIERDTAMEGAAEAERVHRDRYHASERIYLAEADPISLADIVVDNSRFDQPRIVGR